MMARRDTSMSYSETSAYFTASTFSKFKWHGWGRFELEIMHDLTF